MAQLDPHQIVQFFETAKVERLASARDTVRKLVDRYQNNGMDIRRVISNLPEGWTGSAQEAATQGLVPVGQEALLTSDKLSEIHETMDAQVAMFYLSAMKITPMPAKPAISNPLPLIAIGALPLSALEQVNAYNSAAQQNVDTYQEYASYIHESATALPDLSGWDDNSKSAPIDPSAGNLKGNTKDGTPHHGNTGAAPATTRPADAGSRSTGAGPSSTVAGAAPVGTSPTGGVSGGDGTGPSGDTSTAGSTDPSSRSGVTVPSSVGQPAVASDGAADGGVGVPRGGGLAGGQHGVVVGGVVGVGRSGVVGVGPGRGALAGGGRGGTAFEGDEVAGAGEDEVVAGRGTGGAVEPVATGMGARKKEDRERERRFVQDEDHSVEFGVPELFPPAVLGEKFERNK